MTDTVVPLHFASLRDLAPGRYSTKVGTELLIRAFGGRFAGRGNPWIVQEDDVTYVDFERIVDHIGGLSGGEQRFLRLVASLGGGEPVALGAPSEAWTGPT
ncbi:hypothetical protein ACX80Z_15375 [Arthrobacter sp. TMT4-20]